MRAASASSTATARCSPGSASTASAATPRGSRSSPSIPRVAPWSSPRTPRTSTATWRSGSPSRSSRACPRCSRPSRRSTRSRAPRSSSWRAMTLWSPNGSRRSSRASSRSPDRARQSTGRAAGSALVEILASAGRHAAARGISVLAQENLVEADGAALEGDGGARQIEEPRAVSPLADQRARLVGAGPQPLDPLAARPRVVQAQAFHVEDLPAGPLHLRECLRQPGEVAVGEDVAVEEIGLAGAPPVEFVSDAVVQVEAAVVQQLAEPLEEGRVV